MVKKSKNDNFPYKWGCSSLGSRMTYNFLYCILMRIQLGTMYKNLGFQFTLQQKLMSTF